MYVHMAGTLSGVNAGAELSKELNLLTTASANVCHSGPLGLWTLQEIKPCQ